MTSLLDWGQAAFSPRRIALVGASEEKGKAGKLLMDNLLRNPDTQVVPIHPSAAAIMGLPAYATVADVPQPVDLAIVVTPAGSTPAILRDCAAARVPVVMVLSGGFAETGAAGAALEQELRAIAQANGIRLIGPNCLGVIDSTQQLNASMAMGIPASGGVALFTQSGSYAMAAFSRSQEGAIGFSKVLSAGNKADVNEVDAVRFFGADPATRVLALVLESVSDGAALVQALRAVTPHKPVVILKTGRSQAGQRAASSHTAALAQDFAITRALLRQAGAILVDDGLTLFDVAAALDCQGVLRGPRVAIISNSGGTGVELTDLCEAQGLQVPQLSSSLQAAIAAHLPAHGSAANPIDVTTAWARFPAMYGQSIQALLESDEVDAVIPVLLQRSALDEGVIDAVIAQSQQARAKGIDKPIHVCWAAPAQAEPMRRKLMAAGIPCHDWAARSARVLAHCRTPMQAPPVTVQPALPFPAAFDTHAAWPEPAQLFAQLDVWDLPLAAYRCVDDAPAAVQAARALGFPVALKAIRTGLLHKTEAGAVRLNLCDADAVLQACADFDTRLGQGPVLVQAQAKPGVELMLGAVRDPTFGPVIVFGLGGVWAEVLGDVVMRLCPLSPAEVELALTELRAQALLDGARGTEPVDRHALAQLISRVSEWIARAPWCRELDLNPVIAHGSSFVIVDARMRVEKEKP